MQKKTNLSVQSFVNYNGRCINLSSISKAHKNKISQSINIKALNRLDEGYIFEKGAAKSHISDKNK